MELYFKLKLVFGLAFLVVAGVIIAVTYFKK